MLSLLVPLAFAQETVDLGVLRNSELKVVQKQLYVKEDRNELGAHLGVLPFDGMTVAPQLAVTAVRHLSETIGAEVRLAGGYGLETARYQELYGDHGVAYEAYRFLGSVEADLQWTPIYAKLNLGGKKVLHHDVYGLVGVGLTVEQSLLPTGDLAFSPTVPLGVGARVYLSKQLALRAEFRDSLIYQYRAQSQTGGIKQNAGVTVGLSLLTGSK